MVIEKRLNGSVYWLGTCYVLLNGGVRFSFCTESNLSDNISYLLVFFCIYLYTLNCNELYNTQIANTTCYILKNQGYLHYFYIFSIQNVNALITLAVLTVALAVPFTTNDPGPPELREKQTSAYPAIAMDMLLLVITMKQ